jgi:tRNA dimethylallyltransferase
VPVKAVLIAGPTASGKSGVALELACRLGGTVINADSMQVYRELRVLTSRPSESEEARAPHRLYGTISAAEACSVGRWLDDVAHALAEAQGQARLPILVGGTGLYFKALTEGLAPVPEIPAELRAYWREQAAKLSREALHQELASRDPAMAARVKPADPQRIVRALEVIDATGVSLAEWQGGSAAPLLGAGEVLPLVIAPEREPLYAAINARFDRMIEVARSKKCASSSILGSILAFRPCGRTACANWRGIFPEPSAAKTRWRRPRRRAAATPSGK